MNCGTTSGSSTPHAGGPLRVLTHSGAVTGAPDQPYCPMRFRRLLRGVFTRRCSVSLHQPDTSLCSCSRVTLPHPRNVCNECIITVISPFVKGGLWIGRIGIYRGMGRRAAAPCERKPSVRACMSRRGHSKAEVKQSLMAAGAGCPGRNGADHSNFARRKHSINPSSALPVTGFGVQSVCDDSHIHSNPDGVLPTLPTWAKLVAAGRRNIPFLSLMFATSPDLASLGHPPLKGMA